MNIKQLTKDCNLPLDRVTAIVSHLKSISDLSKIADTDLIKIIQEINDFIAQGDTVEIAVDKLTAKYNRPKSTDTGNLTLFINEQSDKISDLLSDNFAQLILEKTWQKTIVKLSNTKSIESEISNFSTGINESCKQLKTIDNTAVYVLTGNVV